MKAEIKVIEYGNDTLKYHASRDKALYEKFYHPNDPHRVDHWKERHNQFVKQYNEEKYW